MDIQYREATLNDLDILCEIRKKQLGDEGIEASIMIDEELHEFFSAFFKSHRIYEILGCIKNEIIATGAVCFYDYPPTYTNKSGHIAYITNMYTREDYRGQGIASEILKMLESEVKKRGVEIIRLGASKLGRPVYEKMGYVQDDEWLSKRVKSDS